MPIQVGHIHEDFVFFGTMITFPGTRTVGYVFLHQQRLKSVKGGHLVFDCAVLASQVLL